MVKAVARRCLNRWDLLVILLCAIVQAYVDGVNSKIFFFVFFCFCFLFCFCFVFFLFFCLALFGLNLYCCFCNFTESILMAFFGLLDSFEQNSVTQRHCSLSSSSCVNHFNNDGSNICIYKSIRAFSVVIFRASPKFEFCSDKCLKFFIYSWTAKFDDNLCSLAVVRKVYSHRITQLFAILQSVVK